MAGHQGNLFTDPNDPRPENRQFSVDKAVHEYLKTGIDPKQLGIGLASYGRGWKGVTSSTPWGSANGAAPGTWEAGNEDFFRLKTRGTDYYDPEIVAAWNYNGDQWWSYANELSTKRKAQYIIDLRLGGGMWWETSGDRDNELISVLADQLRSGQPGDVIDPVDPTYPTDPTDPTDPGTPGGSTTWVATKAYVGGDTVTLDGVTYRAKLWNQSDKPGTSQWGPWELV